MKDKSMIPYIIVHSILMETYANAIKPMEALKIFIIYQRESRPHYAFPIPTTTMLFFRFCGMMECLRGEEYISLTLWVHYYLREKNSHDIVLKHLHLHRLYLLLKILQTWLCWSILFLFFSSLICGHFSSEYFFHNQILLDVFPIQI